MHRRRIYTEEKAKGCHHRYLGGIFIQIIAVLAILQQDDLNNRMNSSCFHVILVQNSLRGQEFNQFCPANSSDDPCVIFCINPTSTLPWCRWWNNRKLSAMWNLFPELLLPWATGTNNAHKKIIIMQDLETVSEFRTMYLFNKILELLRPLTLGYIYCKALSVYITELILKKNYLLNCC